MALALPALERAAKLQKRAARTGFDWPDIEGPKAKIREELDEIAEAPAEELEEEVGDLLFAVVNFARHLKIDPEEALRKANRKFEKRFRLIEATPGFEQMSLDEMEALWVEAKKALKPFEPGPILRAELHFELELVAVRQLLNHLATRMKPGDPRSITGIEADMMGLRT